MPESAERIQPEQDYADAAAAEYFTNDRGATDELRAAFAAIIRRHLRSEATEAWICYTQDGVLLDHLAASQERADEYEKHGYTVRRVLVLEAPA